MVDLAWAAGLFEGEGTWTTCRGRPRLQLKMAAEESVRRFAEVVGAGKVYGPYGPYASSLGPKQHWLWVAEGDDYDRVRDLLSPYTSSWVFHVKWRPTTLARVA